MMSGEHKSTRPLTIASRLLIVNHWRERREEMGIGYDELLIVEK